MDQVRAWDRETVCLGSAHREACKAARARQTCSSCPNCPKLKSSGAASRPPWKAPLSPRSRSIARTCAFRFEADFAKRLLAQRVSRLTRRAKYIIAETDSGLGLAMHLGMTGRFTILRKAPASDETPGAFYYDYDADPRHDHVVFGMSNGDVIRYNDVRRFGYMTLFPAKDMAATRFSRISASSRFGRPVARLSGGPRFGQGAAAESFSPGSARDRGTWQYLCLRSAVPREAAAGCGGRRARQGKKGAAAAKRLCASIKAVLKTRFSPAAPRSAITAMPTAAAAGSRKSLTFTDAAGSLVTMTAAHLLNGKRSKAARPSSARAAKPSCERKRHGL